MTVLLETETLKIVEVALAAAGSVYLTVGYEVELIVNPLDDFVVVAGWQVDTEEITISWDSSFTASKFSTVLTGNSWNVTCCCRASIKCETDSSSRVSSAGRDP